MNTLTNAIFFPLSKLLPAPKYFIRNALMLQSSSTPESFQPIIIDDFSETDTGPIALAHDAHPIVSNSFQDFAPEAIGTYRDVRVDNPDLTHSSETSSYIGAGPSFGGFLFDCNSGFPTNPIKSDAHIVWDGDDSPDTINSSGLGAVDLTVLGGNCIEVNVSDVYLSEASTPDGFTLTLTCYSDAGTVSYSVNKVVSSPASVYFFFSEFTGVDFTTISCLSLDIAGNFNASILISLVKTNKLISVTANFTYSGITATAFATDIQFTDTSSGDIASWSWELAPETTPDTTPNPVYNYGFGADSITTYDVSLTVTGIGGGSDTITKPVSIYFTPTIDTFVDSLTATYIIDLIASSSGSFYNGSIADTAIGNTRKLGIIDAVVPVGATVFPSMIGGDFGDGGRIKLTTGDYDSVGTSLETTVGKFRFMYDGPGWINWGINGEGFEIEDVSGFSIKALGTDNYLTRASEFITDRGFNTYFEGFDLTGGGYKGAIKLAYKNLRALDYITITITVFSRNKETLEWGAGECVQTIGHEIYPDSSTGEVDFPFASFVISDYPSLVDFTKVTAIRVDIECPSWFEMELGNTYNNALSIESVL